MTEEAKNQEVEQNETVVAQEETNEQVDLTNIASLKKGDTVQGTIVKVEDNQAIVDVAYKYDGVIPVRELSSLQLDNAQGAVEVGQKVELKVVSIDDEKEKLVLSKRQIDSEKAWSELQEKLDNRTTFEVAVADVVKGGLVVDVGVRGFIPASMVERHFVEDFSDYKGRTLRVKVKELDKENNKLILSQKDVLDEEFDAGKKATLANLSVNQELEGTVQRITPFGAFVDLGGIDGLVHISEMSWNRIEHPSLLVKEGDKVRVKILKLDPETEKISLSIKATQPGPWETAAGQFKIGETVEGTVKRLVNFGAFVEIAPGVEGLVHISQISHKHIATPHEVLKEGQEVKAKILDLNVNEKRVSLSIKETEEAPAHEPKPAKSKQPKEEYNSANVTTGNQSLSLTLGERFGDKLSKWK